MTINSIRAFRKLRAETLSSSLARNGTLPIATVVSRPHTVHLHGHLTSSVCTRLPLLCARSIHQLVERLSSFSYARCVVTRFVRRCIKEKALRISFHTRIILLRIEVPLSVGFDSGAVKARCGIWDMNIRVKSDRMNLKRGPRHGRRWPSWHVFFLRGNFPECWMQLFGGEALLNRSSTVSE